jgi:thioredoxin-like negative regulator of GroEL
MAMSLYGFYAENGLLTDALAIANQMHSRQANSDSAAIVAETALMMKKPEIAAEALSKLDAAKHSPMSRALLGIALAQQGKKDEAKRTAGQLRVSAEDGAAALYAAARLQAVTGDTAAALTTLRACFESVLPSRLEEFKQHAKECGEFASLAKSADFAAVLKTESKMPESKCSSGSSCAGCPMRGKCPPEEKP